MKDYAEQLCSKTIDGTGVYQQKNGKWLVLYEYASGAAAVYPGYETENLARSQLLECIEATNRFWIEKIRWAERGDHTFLNDRKYRDVLRVNGVHYTVGHQGVIHISDLDMFGHGGRTFRYRFLDDPEGRVLETNNLWCQGTIPEDRRDRLPDNAVFIRPDGSEVR